MIEIHAHVLPGLDDGAASQAEAEALLAAYVQQGVSDLICTSHMTPAQLRQLQQDDYAALYCARLADLRQWLRQGGHSLRLHAGHELVLIPDLLLYLQRHQRQGRELLSLAGSAYLLVELPHWLSGGISSLERLLFGLRMAGYEPILAHPERIVAFASVLPLLRQWVEQERVYLQVNASALVAPAAGRQERFRRRRAHVDQLIRLGLVAFASSDAHDLAERPPQHDRLHQVLSADYGQAVADALLISNPQAVLEDRPVRPVRS